MRIKVDNDEYTQLKRNFDMLKRDYAYLVDRVEYIDKNLDERIAAILQNKTHTYMVERDKDMIVAEVRENLIKNMFGDKE